MKRSKNRGILEKGAKRMSDRIILNNDNTDERKVMDVCMSQHKRILNPIIDWTDEDVWEFLHSQGCEGNPLYQCGFKRVGCIGCPQAYYKTRESDFERYPGFKKMYLSAFAKMLEKLHERGVEKTSWKTPEDVFHWWVYGSNERHHRDLDGQLTLDDII
jgi:phosphoadenosine phosphosulfate reductase